jgi:ketosteroid isomerase-like protein
MSSDDNVKTITSAYEAFARGDIPAVIDALADDVDWASEAASTEVPWWGPRHGKAEVLAFFEALGTAMELKEFTPLVIVGDGDDVLTVVRYQATSRANGKTASMEIHHHWRFRDGKIVRYRGSEDTLQTLEVYRG